MSAAALTLIAILLEIEAGLAVVDRGAADGLQPGDRGLAFYTLYVGDERRPVRIEAGELEVVAVEQQTARLKPLTGTVVRRGYSVELRLPDQRRMPDAAPEAATPPRPPPEEPARAESMVEIPGGDHDLGADLGEARFYNQSPRFRATLGPFRIDRIPVARNDFEPPESPAGEPVTGTPWATDLSYAEAGAHCRRLGKRLPTELEWEVAARRSAIEAGDALFEWTSSWYQPYPGNRFPEQEYGRRFRTLRGGGEDFRLRHFMAPGKSRADVGFRCARSDPD